MGEPGVYLLAYTDSSVEGHQVQPTQIYYVGMSNPAKGIKQRPKRFAEGVMLSGRHFAAKRRIKRYGVHTEGGPCRFYVAVQTMPCDTNKNTARPSDWRAMGQVACLEKYALAHILEKTGRLPELNRRLFSREKLTKLAGQ